MYSKHEMQIENCVFNCRKGSDIWQNFGIKNMSKQVNLQLMHNSCHSYSIHIVMCICVKIGVKKVVQLRHFETSWLTSSWSCLVPSWCC